MIDIKNADVFYQSLSTWKRVSLDKENHVSMINDERCVIDFDDVKMRYEHMTNFKDGGLCSVDGLYFHEDKNDVLLIEFKNGRLSSKISGETDVKKSDNITKKGKDSVYIFNYITNTDDVFVHSNIEFILVYNESKNEKHKKSICDEVFRKAKTEMILFGLSKIKGDYKDVHTYTVSEFKEKVLDNLTSMSIKEYMKV